MADIGLNYTADTRPPQVGVRFGLSFNNTTLRATVRGIDNFVIMLTPSGNIAETIVSGIGWPLAQTIGAILPQLGKDLINGISFDVVTISPTQQQVADEQITIIPSNLSLSNAGGMLMVQGQIEVQ